MSNRLPLAGSLAALVAVGFISGCAATSVKRVAIDKVIDLSGKWNDTDSRLTAEEMIQDCLSRPWLARARRKSRGNPPTVIVGTIRNRSHEHINTQTFIEDLQRSLINSGDVDFVASRDERDEVRDERLDQDTHASEETRKEHGQETGADFMLKGSINTILDKEGGRSVMLYQVNLKLINMKTNRIAWNGSKKIKKYIKRRRASW